MRNLFGSASSAAMVIACCASPAFAQESVPSEPATQEPQQGINVIIVTAQKRAQDVQDVPIAISAFDAEALQERAVADVSALGALAPNVNLDGGTPFSGSSAVLSAFIRGIGSDDFAFNIDPGVGIYLDGVYLARTVGANQDLPDVERIEVLKGPQGTLFGRNTIGGAISIVTHTPGNEFRVRGDVTVGSYDWLRARGTVDVPLADGLYSSFTFAASQRDGFVRRIPYPGTPAERQAIANSDSYTAYDQSGYGRSDRESGDGSRTVRGKLLWDDGGSFRATLSGDYTSQDSSGQNNSLLGVVFPPGPFVPVNPLPGTAINPVAPVDGSLFAGLYNFCINSTMAQIAARNAQAICGVRGTNIDPARRLPALAGVNTDGDPTNDRLPWDGRFITGDPDRSYATGLSFNDLTAWGLNATLEYDLSDSFTMRSISAYREIDWQAGLDADGSPLTFLELSFDQQQWQVSQEVQLLGTGLFDGLLDLVLGGYYFREEGSLQDYVIFAEGLLQVDGPNSFATENYAFFGQADFRVTDWLGFTIGGRYTSEDKAFEGGQQDINGGSYKLFNCADANGNIFPFGDFPLAPPQAAGGPPCLAALNFPDPSDPVRLYVPGVNRKSFSNFSPKFGVQLYPTPDMLVYGSYAEGYKTGGWTTRLSNPQGNVAPDFDEETAKTFELGVKSTLLDNTLQLNAAAFTTDYSNVQLNQQVGTSPTIDNAGDARIKGVEVEAVIAPTPGLTVNASVGYIDASFTAVDPGTLAVSGAIPGLQAGIAVGSPLPKTADWSINVSPRYEAVLGNGGSLTFLADWTHRTEIWNDVARTLLVRRPTTNIVNGSIRYEEPEGRWSITGGITNLFEDRYLVSGNANAADGVIFGAYNRPREYYLRLGFEF